MYGSHSAGLHILVRSQCADGGLVVVKSVLLWFLRANGLDEVEPLRKTQMLLSLCGAEGTPILSNFGFDTRRTSQIVHEFRILGRGINSILILGLYQP